MQNQTPAITRSMLTAWRVCLKTPQCCSPAADRWERSRGQVTLGRCYHSLQVFVTWFPSGILRSSYIDSNIDVFFPYEQSTQAAWLIHPHYLVFFIYIFIFFLSEKSYSQLVFMSTTAGSLWNLQAIQSMCQIEQDKVSNVRRNIDTCCLFSSCCDL